MRTLILGLLCLALPIPLAQAQVKAEPPGIVTMAPPTPAWAAGR